MFAFLIGILAGVGFLYLCLMVAVMAALARFK